MTSAEGVRAEFVRRVGRPPAGIWAAPGRVNLIGEHTDYCDGFVLPMALDKQVLVAAAPADAGTRVWSCQQPAGALFLAAQVVPGEVSGWAAYVAGVCWAMREHGCAVPEVDLVLSGDVPLGAGLSSSAALGCAVALGLADLAGVQIGATDLALLVQRAENEFVGVPTGVMDQLAAMHGRRGQLVHIDTRSLDVEHVPFDLAMHDLALVVIDTGAPRVLADGRYGQRRRACEEASRLLGVPALRDVEVEVLDSALGRLPEGALRGCVRHVVTENARVRQVVGVLRAGTDPRSIGVALTASHASLRDDFRVTVPELDVAVGAALAGGAYGARMTGGGFGGCVIALADRGAAAEVVAGIERAFAGHGFGRPVAFEANPAAGARRLVP